jgi:hypothetical protein
MSQPDALVGLNHEALRARCGSWQDSRLVTGTMYELNYVDTSGTLLLRVTIDSKVMSAATR